MHVCVQLHHKGWPTNDNGGTFYLLTVKRIVCFVVRSMLFLSFDHICMLNMKLQLLDQAAYMLLLQCLWVPAERGRG